MKILHTADLHLGSPITANLPPDKARVRRAELSDCFIRIADYAEKNGIEAVIIAGDIFDSARVPASCIKLVSDVITAHPGLIFYCLSGNHDGGRLSALLDPLPENARLFNGSRAVYRTGNTVICGCEVTSGELCPALPVFSENDFNILVLHGQESFSPSASDGLISIPMLSDININYLALGHLHYKHGGSLGKRGIYRYPGTPEGRGFDETGEKGFIVIDTEEKVPEKTAVFVPFSKRRLHEITIPLTQDDTGHMQIIAKAEKALSAIPACDMVKLVLTGEFPACCDKDIAGIESAFSGRFFFMKICDESRLHIDIESFRTDISLKGEFIRSLPFDGSPENDAFLKEVALCGIKALKGENIT